MTVKLAVLISGNGSNLQSIIDAIESKRLDAQIAIVISDKTDAFGLERAKNHRIATASFERSQYASRSTHEQAIIDELNKQDIHLIALAGFMRVLSADFIVQFNNKIINIHPSLLPKHKGLNTHQRAIDDNEALHGASVHLVNAQIDGGPVILQKSLDILPQEDAQSLSKRVLQIEHEIYPQAIQYIVQGKVWFNDNKVIISD